MTVRLEHAVNSLRDVIKGATFELADALEATVSISVDALNQGEHIANEVTEEIATEIGSALDVVQSLPSRAAEEMTQLNGAAGEFSSSLNQAIEERLRALGEMRESLTQLTRGLGGRAEEEVDRIASSMVREVSDSVNDALRNINDSVRSEIEAKFRQMLTDAISDIISTQQLAATGAAISGVLAPWLPTIAVAIRMIDALEEALALMRGA